MANGFISRRTKQMEYRENRGSNMQVINQFIFDTLIFLILIVSLIVILLGSLFVLKTMLKEWFGYVVDFTKRRNK